MNTSGLVNVGVVNTEYPQAQYKTVILKPNYEEGVNILTQEMLDAYGANTKFVIKYAFTLGEDIVIPSNCVFAFDGGEIIGNGSGKDTLTGNFTAINSSLTKIFDTSVKLAGRFENGEWDAEWFGVNHTDLNNQVYLNHMISQLSAIKGGNIRLNNDITINDTIWLKRDVSIIGTNTREGTGTWWNEGGTLIRCAFADKNKWAISVASYAGGTIEYNILNFATQQQRLGGIRLENLNIVLMEDDGRDIARSDQTPAFGGIRLYGLTFGTLKNIKIS